MAFAMVLFSPQACANAGGYVRGGVTATGTVKAFSPSGTEHVRILDEQLEVALGMENAVVEVRYVLQNTTSQKVRVRFGFPVEELKQWDWSAGPDARKRDRELEYCRDYQVELDQHRVKAVFESESLGAASEDVRLKMLTGWMVSEIQLKPAVQCQMVIRYRANYSYEIASIADDAQETARIFKYRLSTGAAWAGPIKSGRVTIRAAGADAREVKVLSPADRFGKAGDSWTWEFTDLEPTLADDFTVQAAALSWHYPRRQTDGRYFDGKRSEEYRGMVGLEKRNGAWWMVHQDYQVTASSTLSPQGEERYDATNVRDSRSGAWSEGVRGQGIGEWLEVKPRAARLLRAIRLRTGLYRSETELFQQNSRPRTVEVLLNGKYRFEAQLQDHHDQQIVVVPNYAEPVHTIRLTIKSVYPGTRYEDTCINYLALETPALRAPKVDDALFWRVQQGAH